MTSDRERTRQRLVRLSLPPQDEISTAAPRFVPVRPTSESAAYVPTVSAADAPATAARAEGVALRQRAVAAAVTSYTAAHGHPVEHDSGDGDATERRWATPARAATAVVLVLILLCAAVVLHAVRRAPDAVAQLTPPLPPAQGQEARPGEPSPADVDGASPGTGSDVPAVAAGGDGAAGDGAAAAPDVVVHVVGQVHDPAVVTLPGGSRVADAVAAAGGSTPDADLAALNLARVLLDGEQVVVPRPGEQIPAVTATGAATGADPRAGSSVAVLDLNTADEAALDDLPGIGPVLAQRIIEWRAEHGGFTTVEELREVAGIGSTVLESLRDLVRV